LVSFTKAPGNGTELDYKKENNRNAAKSGIFQKKIYMPTLVLLIKENIDNI
jgi:hypothetical protein